MSAPSRLLARAHRWPVRVRLAIVSAGLTAIILVGFAAVVGRMVSNRLQADFRQEVREAAATLASEVLVRGVSDHPVFVGPDLNQVAMANDAKIRIVDLGGRPYFETNSAPDLGPPSSADIRDAVGALKVSDEPIQSNALTGPLFIQYARDDSDVDATVSRLWLFLGGGVLVGTLLAGVSGMAVAGRAMRPIAALTATARDIAETRDPSVRIPEPETGDEVGELARTLELMLRELDAARGETEQTISRQREFFADASHELRTPLTSILANLELLEASLALDADDDELTATRSALRSSRRMSRLVGDMLLLARVDAGRPGERRRCDLAAIAGEALEEVRPVADGHRLEAEVATAVPVDGDADGLHRMIVNLLENAIRHTPAGTRVLLRVEADGSTARLTVADDGPGLPADNEEKIFNRFVRAEGPADVAGANGRGTGLGLSIVRAVARSHDGEASAGRSAEGGALFSVSIPLAID